MAKNLKLNIKNAQLAEALKLNPPKKILAKKPVKEAEELSSEPILEQKAREEPITPIIETQNKELDKQPSSFSREIEKQEVVPTEVAPLAPKKIITTSYRNDTPRPQQEFIKRPFSQLIFRLGV